MTPETGWVPAPRRSTRGSDRHRAALTRRPYRHLDGDRFIAEASRIDRIAKGRADGDAWVALERLLLAVAEAKAVRLLVA